MTNLDELNAQFAKSAPYDIIAWAVQTYSPAVASSSSFQGQSLPLLHMIAQVAPQMPILFLDTGYHFPETLAFRDRLVQEWGLNLQVLRASLPRADFVRKHGADLYRRDPDLCCYINKVEPMERAMQGFRAWISGVRRDQGPTRANLQILEETPQGVVRVHPLANWSTRHVWQYIHDHNLPDHPLLAQGYLSIGCEPCTRPVHAGEDERSGRWAGSTRTECGLHTLLRAANRSSAEGNSVATEDRVPREAANV